MRLVRDAVQECLISSKGISCIPKNTIDWPFIVMSYTIGRCLECIVHDIVNKTLEIAIQPENYNLLFHE
jgi:hypothetical protein